MNVYLFSRSWLVVWAVFCLPIVALAAPQSSASSSYCEVTIENKTGEEHYFVVGNKKYKLKPGAKASVAIPRANDKAPAGVAGEVILAGRLLASNAANLTIKQVRNPCGKTFSLTKSYVLGPKLAP